MEAIKLSKKEEKKIKKLRALENINGNKSAQMIFKTALRNHIDLTSIADNKSNIMLSINALIITISLPLLASYIGQNFMLIYPTSILLLSCVLSIIYATLATRPINTKGITTPENIMNGSSNLFFFGNFHAMNYAEYKEGIELVITDNAKLDDSISADLFYLGKALGKKFKLLRVCYTLFMIGITLAVLTFALINLVSGL